MTIIESMIADKIAQNVFQAAHIANGLKLAELKTDEERRARYLLYREWRNAGEPSKVAYQNAIDGKVPMVLIEKEEDRDINEAEYDYEYQATHQIGGGLIE